MAFHPNYPENGRFFVNYTDSNGDTIISRFNVSTDLNVADVDSEEILLLIEQPYDNHNGGQLAFGPDGYLYIGMGDGGSMYDPQHTGQNPEDLLGAMLRIDVSGAGDGERPYAIPADNPVFDSEIGQNEVWAIGLRNPWRFSFDRETGDLFIADVGQFDWEEINFQPASSGGGENYGWLEAEGDHCIHGRAECGMDRFAAPIIEYDHEDGSCSVTGGYVYRGQQFSELTGQYFFSDFCSGLVWASFANGTGEWETAVVAETDLSPTSFGEDVHGELYILSRTGEIYQLTP